MNRFKGFSYKEGKIAGDDVFLVTPEDIGVKWTEENKHFRSAIIRKSDQKVISMGFRKFTNLGETPTFEPWDSHTKFNALTKMDGSLLIVSKYKGQLITRTRGTFDARQLDNGHEIDKLISQYPQVFDNMFLNRETHSILLEWTTPNNIIVVRESEEPKLWLIGIIAHDTHEYISQEDLDYHSKQWDVSRPSYHKYNSLAECIDDVKTWKGKEGVVLYNGQIMKKIKGDEYLRLHRAKSAISSIANLIELYLLSNTTSYEDFYNYIELTLDHELAEIAKDDIKKITECNSQQLIDAKEVQELVDTLDGKTRKDQALIIIDRWKDWRKSYAFHLLDKKKDEFKINKILEEYYDKR